MDDDKENGNENFTIERDRERKRALSSHNNEDRSDVAVTQLPIF